MPLIDDEPPSTRPRGQYSLRSFRCFCGTVQKPQSYGLGLSGGMMLPMPAGMLISIELSRPPASSSSTRVRGSADSRLASTQPALPAPTITKS